MENEVSKFDNKEKEKKKTLIIKKYNLSMDKQGQIYKQIKIYKESEKIFEFNDKIKLGKLEILKGPRFDKDKNLIPYSYIGPDRFFITRRREAIKSISPLFKYESRRNKTNNKDFSKILSDKDIYSKFNSLGNKNSIINREKKALKPIPKYIKIKLDKQEKMMKRFGTFDNLEENIEKMLLKKTNKNKKDLLLKISDTNNSIGGYIKYNDINANLKNWNFELRNPKIKGLYKRKGYFKATSLNEDLYSIINLNKTKQIFVNPFKNIYVKDKKNSLNKKISKEIFLSSLKLKGVNVLEKVFQNRRKKNEIINENTPSSKTNSFRNFIQNFSFLEKNERIIDDNLDEKTFISDYDNKYEYNKSENINKFHN